MNQTIVQDAGTPPAVGLSIEHIALWTRDIERSRAFYEQHFAAKAGERYVSKRQPLISYFLDFGGGARLEIMTSPEISDQPDDRHVGLAHFALRIGSREAVNQMVEKLRMAHVAIAGEPRMTGDGYYEAVVHDPDGNIIELIA
jgi:lactoylglutathione lyase